MKYKNKEWNIRNKVNIFALFLFLVSIFMGIVYAAINSVSLNITGEIAGEIQEGVYITSVNYKESTNTTKSSSSINNMYQTVLNSSIALSPTVGTSSITYTITILNTTNTCYEFEGVQHAKDFYDNTGITYTLSGLEIGDPLYDKEEVVFDITFSYLNGTAQPDNILNSYLNFDFLAVPNKVKVILTDVNGNVEKKLVDPEVGTVTFAKTEITDGVIARANNGATPVFDETTKLLTATGITKNTNCNIFNSLKESVETADTTTNNMLMIANENATAKFTLASGKTINLDINGKQHKATLSSGNSIYITNNGKFNVFDNKSSGKITTNCVLTENRGTMVIKSGQYQRSNSSSTAAPLIRAAAGSLKINGGTYKTDSVNCVLAVESGTALIKNSTLTSTGNLGNTITNATNGQIVSALNCTISSTTGAGLTSMGSAKRSYIAKCTINAGIADLATAGGEIHYTADTVFKNGGNSPSYDTTSTASNQVVKNFATNCAEDWYYIKDSAGNKMKYADGTYMLVGDRMKIISKLSSSLVLDIYAGVFATKQNVDIYTSNDTNAQRFTFLASNTKNYYNIAPYYAPTFFLNVESGNSQAVMANGLNVWLYAGNDRNNEKYKFVSTTATNYYQLASYYSNYVIDITAGEAVSGTNVQVWTSNTTDAQRWKFEKK